MRYSHLEFEFNQFEHYLLSELKQPMLKIISTKQHTKIIGD
jgi:hypothetical protein